jgi:hypothetical protein
MTVLDESPQFKPGAAGWKGMTDEATPADEFAPPNAAQPSTPAEESRLPPLGLAISVVVLTLVAFLQVLLFSDIGFGIEVFNALGPRGALDNMTEELNVDFVVWSLLLVLYLLDAEHWTSCMGRFFFLSGLSLAGCAVFFSAMLSSEATPQWALAAVTLLLPVSASIIRAFLFDSHVPPHVILRVFSIAFAVAATLVLIAWGSWVGSGNLYTEANRNVLAMALHCPRPPLDVTTTLNVTATLNITASLNVTTMLNVIAGGSKTDDDGRACLLTVALLWACPLILSMGCFLFACIFFLFGRFMQKSPELAAQVGLKAGFVAIACGVWVGFSFNGFSSKLFHSLVVLLFTVLWVVAGILVSTLGWKWFVSSSENSDAVLGMKRRLNQYDALKGAVVLMGLPLLVPYLMVHTVKQFFRRARGHAASSGPLTGEATVILLELKRWAWVSVLSWTSLWCWLAWGSLYIPVLTNIVVAYFIQLLAPLNWAIVSFLFLALGFVMCLNPFFPGPVFYLMGGVLLVPLCDHSDSRTILIATILIATIWTLVRPRIQRFRLYRPGDSHPPIRLDAPALLHDEVCLSGRLPEDLWRVDGRKPSDALDCGAELDADARRALRPLPARPLSRQDCRRVRGSGLARGRLLWHRAQDAWRRVAVHLLGDARSDAHLHLDRAHTGDGPLDLLRRHLGWLLAFGNLADHDL